MPRGPVPGVKLTLFTIRYETLDGGRMTVDDDERLKSVLQVRRNMTVAALNACLLGEDKVVHK
jgi:hypothetical protein